MTYYLSLASCVNHYSEIKVKRSINFKRLKQIQLVQRIRFMVQNKLSHPERVQIWKLSKDI